VQIQTNYSSNPYLSSTDPASAGQDKADETSKIDSPEYKAITNKASVLLGNPDISAAQRTKILNLLARGKVAASNGSTEVLNNLFNEMKKFDPGLAVKGDSFQKGTSKPQGVSNQQDDSSITYQDQSGDIGVSFKYPVAVNKYEAPLAVSAHEGEHVFAAQIRALMNNESVTTYVSINNGYDSKGRLYITGGTTTAIYHQKPKMEPSETKVKNKVNTYV